MRARNIKPDFFRDAELSEVSIEARYLFIGLWCLADREGKLKDNPKQIRFEVFPETKTRENIENLLNSLVLRHLIERYEVSSQRYIKVVNFLKHQSPHSTEKASTIPDPVSSRELTENNDSGKNTNDFNDDVSSREATLTNVDIPLIPDSLIPDKKILSAEPTPSPLLSVQDLAKTWNEAAPSYLPRAKIPLSDKRTKKLRRNVNGHDDLEYWRRLFKDIDKSDFHSGRDGKWLGMQFDWAVTNHEKLRMTLDRAVSRDSPARKSCAACSGSGFRKAKPGEPSINGRRVCECRDPNWNPTTEKGKVLT